MQVLTKSECGCSLIEDRIASIQTGQRFLKTCIGHRFANYLNERLDTEGIEYEPYNETNGTLVLQEALSLDLIKKVFEAEIEIGVKITDIRNHPFGLCVDFR